VFRTIKFSCKVSTCDYADNQQMSRCDECSANQPPLVPIGPDDRSHRLISLAIQRSFLVLLVYMSLIPVSGKVMMQTKAVTLQTAGQPPAAQPPAGQPQTWWGFTAAIVSAATVLFSSTAVRATPIENWQFDPQANQLSFVLPDGIKPRYFIMAQPARIVVDIPNAQLGDLPLEQEFAGDVKRISISQLQPQLMRVILEMSPKAVFGRGQVKLDNVGDFGLPSKDRWVITPVLQGDAVPNSRKPLSAADAPVPSAPPATQPIAPKPIAPKPQAAQPVEPTPIAKPARTKPEPKPAETPPGMESVVNAPLTIPSAAPARPSRPISPAVPPPSSQRESERVPVMQLPPAPPSQAAMVIDRPTIVTPAVTPAVTPPRPGGPAASVMPQPVMRPDLIGPSSTGQGSSPLPLTAPLPAVQPMVSVPPLATITALPPAPSSSMPGLPPMPPLATALPPSQPPTMPSLPTSLPNLPNLSTASPSNASGMPALPPVAPRDVIRNQIPPIANPPNLIASSVPTIGFGTIPAAPVPTTAMAARPSSGVIDFGQPLPTIGSPNPIGSPIAGIQALDNITTGGITLPAGNVLSLRYDRGNGLKLKPGERQQEILVLQTPILDSAGRVVVPQGSLVLGDFDTDKVGSRFTARVLSTPKSNLSILAQSNFLQSARQISNRNLLQNSGIGAVAGAIVGGLGGSVLGGAAAGAALTYATSPKETLIQPGQIVEVRLVQDFLAYR
jgi:AMIN domain